MTTQTHPRAEPATARGSALVTTAAPGAAAGGGAPATSSAGLAPGVEPEVLADRRQAEAPGFGAELGGGEVVLGVEHRLSPVEERPQLLALAELGALLDDREVERVGELGDLVEVVLQADRQAPLVRQVGDHVVERELVVGGDVEAGALGVAVHPVGLSRIRALLGAQVEAGGDQRPEHVEAADVEPALVLPALNGTAHDVLGVVAGVG